MRYSKGLLIIFLITITLSACKDDIENIQFVDYTLQVVLEDASRFENINLKGLTVIVTNVNTNNSFSFVTNEKGQVSFTNLIGVYNTNIEGRVTVEYKDDNGKLIQSSIRVGGTLDNEFFTVGKDLKDVNLKIKIENKGWVIKEMYTASTTTLNGGSLRFDQFIEIYNNTDSVKYADGMVIGETRHQTTSGENIYAKDMDEKTYLWTFYAIPGKNGEKNVPVEPGKSIVIAPQPIDHRENNSIDLRPPVSDYQWFDAYGSGQFSIDVPDVPNLERYYSYSLSVWVVTVQMNRGFAIVQLPEGVDMETFVDENLDTRLNTAGNPVISVGVPNEYILDAVELGYRDKFYKKSLFASLDQGRAYTLATYNGKSIRRKIEEIKPDGRIVYKDTNNSSYDFWTSRKPSPKKYPTDDEVSHE